MVETLSFVLMVIAMISVTSAFVVQTPSRGLIHVQKASRYLQPSGSTRTIALPRGSSDIRMKFVAMNRFKVKLGCEEDFEKVWRERESKLQDFSGFKEFMLLRVDKGDDPDDENSPAATAGYTEFVSHTTWMHKLDFEEWRRSQSFKQSHGKGDGEKPPGAGAGAGAGGAEAGPAGGGAAGPMMSKVRQLLVERPVPSFYDAVLVEPTPPEHKGGLWEFENEPAYFDGDM